MKKRVGILTSGGDCPGLNATIRGVAKALYHRFGDDVEIIGIVAGYHGLIHGEYHMMKPSDFSGILNVGGTILGTARTPYSKMKVIEDDKIDKVQNMITNYKKMKLDCLLTLGGNGTHKTSNLLAEQGLNIIGLPKTIDNDIFGTDVTFGFHSAVNTATDVIDRLHTTATSHKRVMVVEIMGNKAGWLTLYSGIAGGADVIIIPEIPFTLDKILAAVERRIGRKKGFSVIAVAEGAMDKKEAKMKKKERLAYRAENGESTVTSRIVRYLAEKGELDCRAVVPGHFLRGGPPSAYDRVLSSQFGAYAAGLVAQEKYGVTVALKNNQVCDNPLKEIAGKTKFVDPNDQLIATARDVGTAFGD